MPLDFSLLGPAPRINTPFENLSQILQVRNQQEAQRGLAEQRRAIAQQTDERTNILKQQQADTAALDTAVGAGGSPDDILARVPGHLRATVRKQLQDASEWDTKVKTARTEAEKAELGYAAHLASGVLSWEKDGPEALMNAAQTALQVAKSHGHDVSQLEQVLAQDPTKLKPMLESIIAQHQGPAAKSADYTLGDQRFSGETNKPVATAAPKPEKVSYGAPQTQMVNGRRSLVRPGSDGRMYSMDLKPIEGNAIAPEPQGGGAKPSYEWASVGGQNKLLTPDEIRAQGGTKPMSAMEGMDERKYKKAAPVLASIAELSEKINTGSGLLAKMAGGASKVAAKANYDDDVAEYQALVSGFTPMVARALGHTGVLTQQDVDSVKMLFPAPGDSKTLRDRKLKRVMGIIGELEGATNGPAKPAPSAPPAASGGRIRVVGPNGEKGTVPDDGKPLPAGWSRAAG